jgi:5-methylthioribose kinase
MFEISAETAADYLRSSGRAERSEPIEVRELAGGVSNVVLHVTMPKRGEQFVLKQARGRLRVKEEWHCPVERIWREMDVLRICGRLVRARSKERGAWSEGKHEALVPEILWEDRQNFAFAMTSAPPEHKTWKELLLAGETQMSDPNACACGRLLGQLHGGSWGDAEFAALFNDRTYFDQLRLDPYYRHVARIHRDLAAPVERLIDSVWNYRRCLVHGDYSPKNLLVWPGHVMLIDFEVGHYGDPAFDLGFFLTHLVLKSIWGGERRQAYLDLATQFWLAYQTTLAAVVGNDNLAFIEQRMIVNLAACMLARVDGKSPVEYLSPEQQRLVRDMARDWLLEPPCTWGDAIIRSTEY